MLVAILTLLFTTLSIVGLAAAWAATSPRPWFLRASLFVGMLAPLLLIPAYEPFVAFVIQGLVAALGVRVYRWRQMRFSVENYRRQRTRFSISTLLQATVLIALAAAVTANLPELTPPAWTSVLLIGVMSGVATLLGLWVVLRRRPLRVLGIVFAVAAFCFASMTLVCGDWFVLSVVDEYGYWPPLDDDLMFMSLQSGFKTSLLWVPILAGVAGFLGIAVYLAVIVKPGARFANRWSRVASKCGLALMAAILVIPPAGIYFRLMTPRAIPETPQLDANGWNDFAAAGRMLEISKSLATIDSYDTASKPQLASAVKAISPIYQRLEVGLQKQVQCPVDYSDTDLNFDVITSFRSLARALTARGRLAEVEGRVSDAADSYLDSVRFGYAQRRGGLMIDGLIGTACSGSGRWHLFDCRKKLSEPQCSVLIRKLFQLEKQAEPAEDVIDRDRIWSEHANGWFGHLKQILEELADPGFADSYRSFESACDRELAEMRLLRVELAIQAWRSTRNRLPDQLAELVPEYLSALPVDPFEPSGGLIQYHRTGDAYLLYSVGYNGIDDSGDMAAEPLSMLESGDLRLDVIYASDWW
jgi:hypothetical protein